MIFVNTSFSEIYDLFVRTITDYKINQYFRLGEASLETYLEPYLRFSVVKFDNACETSLSDSLDLVAKEFTRELREKEKVIIAHLMIEPWFRPVENDLIDIEMGLSTTDFKRYSEAQHIKEMRDKMQVIREENSQLLADYQLSDGVDWKEWQNGNFYNAG